MAFSNEGERDRAIAEINIIPLCDVLLVLLIIFMVTAPALSHQIDIDLPQPRPDIERLALPDPVELRIDGSGQVSWDGESLSRQALAARMRDMAGKPPAEQPLLRIDASGDCEYQAVTRVLADASNAGLAKVGFVRR